MDAQDPKHQFTPCKYGKWSDNVNRLQINQGNYYSELTYEHQVSTQDAGR